VAHAVMVPASVRRAPDPAKIDWICLVQPTAATASVEGNIIFNGSTHEKDWKIYHDRLSQWWEAEAQDYIKSKGFGDRQWRASRSTNDAIKAAGDKTNYYVDSLMGDTPEAMPLDSSLFNDLIEANGKAVISTRLEHVTKKDGGKKYTMSDPENAWITMCDMWTSCAIKPQRIIDDITKLRIAFDKIIEASGTIVEELDNRNGHRKVASRICLGGMLHPECEAAMRAQVATWAGLSGPRASLG
jgi:hypothetical protein